VQRPVVDGEEQQCDEQGAHRQGAPPARAFHQVGFEALGHLRGVDDIDGKGDGLIAQV
jgi:hypothetical protein